MMQPTLLSDFLLAHLPKAPVTLRKFMAKKHHKELGRELWQEAIFSVHMQDGRLTEDERKVLAALGRRLHGPRSVT
jgi:hypothetical protein